MKGSSVRLAAAAAVLVVCAFAAPVALAGTARAAETPVVPSRDAEHAVFVQTDNVLGNQVVAYNRAPNGTLTLGNTYATGGLGGVLSGSVVDHLASQGSLVYDRGHARIYAVNAGSNSVSVFSVRGAHLGLEQVLSSGGAFPVSVAVHGDLVYVLNAKDGGSVQGFRTLFGRLIPMTGSSRTLGLNPLAAPQFTNTPGQVAFSPDGSELIVTTKANGSAVDVFAVTPSGQLSAGPVVNSEPGTVPFAISFDRAGNLVIAEAGTNSLASFALNPDQTLTPLASVFTGQAATCWVASVGELFYASNAGSASLSGYRSGNGGQLTLLGTSTTDPGTVDAAASSDNRFLYVQTGALGIVDEFQINVDGSLTGVGSVTVPGAVGGEGIAAS